MNTRTLPNARDRELEVLRAMRARHLVLVDEYYKARIAGIDDPVALTTSDEILQELLRTTIGRLNPHTV